MRTTKPLEGKAFVSPALVAANEPTMPEAAHKDRAPQPGTSRGWDPYDVWRTRVKTPRENDTPAP